MPGLMASDPGTFGALNAALILAGQQRDMLRSGTPFDPENFFADLFGSKAAAHGAVVRRKVRDVERIVGREAFLSEVRRRGFSAVENAGQFVIFCNSQKIRRVA